LRLDLRLTPADRAGLIGISAVLPSEDLQVSVEVYSHTHLEAAMRTNIVLDEEIVKQAFRVSRARTKRALVHEALEELIRVRKRRPLLELKGKVRFAKGYDYKKLRAAR